MLVLADCIHRCFFKVRFGHCFWLLPMNFGEGASCHRGLLQNEVVQICRQWPLQVRGLGEEMDGLQRWM